MAGGISIRWLDIIAVCYIFFQLVHTRAVVDVDLLKFESLPSQCCGGRTWTPFGSTCDDCDPYFTVCLQHIPDGRNKCVQTSRKLNKTTTQLAPGNVQPSRISLELSDWKGSLLMEIDVKGHKDTTDDDDIDSLTYVVKRLPGFQHRTVTVNGSKTSLTISIGIHCEPDYYRSDCGVHCVNGTNYHCGPTGARVCNTGFTGTNCDRRIGEITPTASPSTEPTTASVNRETTGDILSKGTAERTGGDTLTSPSVVQRNSTSSVAEPTRGADSHSSGDQDENRNSSPVRYMTTVRSRQPSKVNIPEPIENFSCNLMIEGHIQGAHERVVTALSTVLGSRIGGSRTGGSRIGGSQFGWPGRSSIDVSVISSTFVVFDSGKRVTDIAYIVSNGGYVLSSTEVSRTLTSSDGHNALVNELNNKNLQQYNGQQVSGQPLTEITKSWVKVHEPFIIVIACVAAILLLVPVVACITSRRRHASTGFKKSSVKSNKSQKSQERSTKETCIRFDTPFVLENPMYDLSFNQLQPGFADN